MVKFLSWLTFVLGISGCVASPEQANGCIALTSGIPTVTTHRGCATQVDEHWAVTVAHVDDDLYGGIVIGANTRRSDYPLVFFPHDGKVPVWSRRELVSGESVKAYGNPGSVLDYLVGLPIPTREEVSGQYIESSILCGTKEESFGRCSPVIWLHVQGGHGYSGGPVVDGSGTVVGITDAGGFAKRDAVIKGVSIARGDTVMAAFPASLVMDEFERLGLSKMKVGKDEP